MGNRTPGFITEGAVWINCPSENSSSTGPVPPSGAEKQNEKPADFTKRIEQLGHPEAEVRKTAMEKLRQNHAAADALRKAAKSHESIEIRHRADSLLKTFAKEKYVLESTTPGAHPDVQVVGGLILSKDGRTAFTKCRRKLSVWDLGEMKVTKSITAPPIKPWPLWLANGPAYFMDLSPDGNFLTTTDPVGTVHFHDLKNNFKRTKLTPSVEIHDQRPGSQALLWHGRFFPKSQKYATSSDSSLIDIWDLKTGKIIETLPKVSTQRGLTFEITPDEKYLIAAFNQEHPEGLVFLWDFAKKKWSNPEPTQMVTSFRFFADGRSVLATGAKGSLYLFELGEEGLKKVKTYNDLGDYAANAVLAPGEKSVFVGLRSPLGEIIELDLETGKVVWRSPPHKQDKATAERLAFLPDGRLLAMFATGEMTIWKKM